MKIVPVSEIPVVTTLVPREDAVAVFKVCKNMEVLCQKSKGIGLAAAQVGIPWKLFIVWDRKTQKWRHFLDCEYEALDNAQIDSVEGCLSLPGKRYRLQRYRKVKVVGSELIISDGSPTMVPFEQVMEFTCGDIIDHVVFQHEIDHANNILISDIGNEIVVRPVSKLYAQSTTPIEFKSTEFSILKPKE